LANKVQNVTSVKKLSLLTVTSEYTIHKCGKATETKKRDWSTLCLWKNGEHWSREHPEKTDQQWRTSRHHGTNQSH